jgi:hypothetical protein
LSRDYWLIVKGLLIDCQGIIDWLSRDYWLIVKGLLIVCAWEKLHTQKESLNCVSALVLQKISKECFGKNYRHCLMPTVCSGPFRKAVFIVSSWKWYSFQYALCTVNTVHSDSKRAALFWLEKNIRKSDVQNGSNSLIKFPSLYIPYNSLYTSLYISFSV